MTHQVEARDTSLIYPHPLNAEIYGDGCDNELLESVRKIGLLNPLLITKDGVIISGHRRFNACQTLKMQSIPVIYSGLTDEMDIEEALIIANRQREKTTEQKTREYRKLKAIEEVRAKERMAEGGGDKKSNAYKESGVQNSSHPIDGKARDIAAEKVGLSHDTAEKAAAVLNIADVLDSAGETESAQEIKDTLNKSVNRAYQDLKPVIDEVKAAKKDIVAIGEREIIAKARELRAERVERAREKMERKKRELEEIDKIKPEPSLIVEPGDMWRLGRHTLYCSDFYANTVIDSVDIDACITDPPYGIDYAPDWKKWDGSISNFRKIEGDDRKFNPESFLKYPTVCLFGAAHFSDMLPIGGWVCWDKRLDETKDAMAGQSFELAWFKTQNTTRKSLMIRVLHGGVVNADSEKGNNEKRFHPTQKPIAVMWEIISALTKKNDRVLDPFSGSGSTLLACEKLERSCIAFEIDPKYACDIISRWEKMTGGKAVKE